MKIAVITRDKIELCPPVLSVVEILRDLNEEVTLITSGISRSNAERFRDKGINIEIVSYNQTDNIVKRMMNVVNYRKKLRRRLNSHKYDLLWIEGAGTFRVTIGMVRGFPFVMQISELYDYPEAKPVVRAISKLIHQAAAVVMPEHNRALIYKALYNLEEIPFVLPNKPYHYLRGEDLVRCESKYVDSLRLFKTKKVILYQGIIADERDLTPYIQAVGMLGDDYKIVLLGPDRGALSKYQSLNPNVVHIDYIPAPDYLVFTANAYAGIITYTPNTLNCLFCAPNKVYEYGCYSLPMIGNDIPGLSETIKKYDAGILVEENIDSITEAIRKLGIKYNYYARNARRLFEETDNKKAIAQILDKIKVTVK